MRRDAPSEALIRVPPLPRSLALVVVGLALLSACKAEIPDATYYCDATADCPPGLTCFGGLCVRDPGDAGPLPGFDAGPCEPEDCAALRAECGEIDDGCGTALDCGACEAPEACGAGGIDNICDCAPQTCAELSAQCGMVGDGCGGTLDCGSCDAPATCDGANECGCASEGCTGRCGMLVDACGDILVCGGCPAGETCGAAGPSLCGMGTCTPTTCAAEGKDCGSISDGCGSTIACGTCATPATCGGGATGMQEANVCGCTPESCGMLGATCGTPTERCGTTLSSCGTCTGSDTCGGGGTPYQCGCTAPSCPASAECGTIPNPCGGPAISCGATCGDGARCVANACECIVDAPEPNDVIGDATAAGLLSLTGPSVLSSYSLHAGGDVDWYVFDLPATGLLPDGTLDIDVSLRGIPSGSDYDLGAWVDCASTRGTVTCDMGTPDMSHFDGGCLSNTPGGANERVVVSAACADRIFVRVDAGSWAPRSCAPYGLEVDISIVSTT